MKKILFSAKATGISPRDLSATLRKLAPECEKMQGIRGKGYDTEYASINLPLDKQWNKKALELARKESRGLDCLFIVGIGGSNLGALAVQEAVLGRYHNLITSGPRVFYADTVDARSMHVMSEMLRAAASKKEKYIINVISKSGSTTETVANFEVLLDALPKVNSRSVIVTTDEGSRLWQLAHEEGFQLLALPAKVGGRYSVFSPVGIFPLASLGIDIRSLLSGAAAAVADFTKPGMQNSAALSASLLYLQRHKGRRIHDTFLFVSDLESVGKWYRQLLAESIGKEFSKAGKKVHEGITPTVSVGSTDLHSMAQLYLGGPDDKFTTFVTVEQHPHVRVPKLQQYDRLVQNLQGKTLSSIMDAIVSGVKLAYSRCRRPFAEITLPDLSPYSIGYLLQFKMLEVIYLAALLNVNPFDQPAVEKYKAETRRILARKN